MNDQIEPATDYAGVPDALQRLWTPHRMVYVSAQTQTPGGCPFCAAPGRSDADGLVVHRGHYCYVVLNLFPYNPGHLLVCPYRHVADWTELTAGERVEIGELTATAMRVLRQVSGPAGFNLGLNQGSAAGAGIAAHLHQHVVPRWTGDSNFLPVIGRTKAVPQLLADTRDLLAAAWADEDTGPDSAERDSTVPDATGSAATHDSQDGA